MKRKKVEDLMLDGNAVGTLGNISKYHLTKFSNEVQNIHCAYSKKGPQDRKLSLPFKTNNYGSEFFHYSND